MPEAEHAYSGWMFATDETTDFRPRWDALGLMPVVAIDDATDRLLMLAYANEAALRATMHSGDAHYWSRSRAELWHKGATSGNTQRIVRVEIDCDQDALIYRVQSAGPACHTGRPTCFYRSVTLGADGKLSLTISVE